MRARESLHSPTIAISPANIPVAVDRDLAITRSHRIEIAIDGAISRRRDRDLPLSPLIFLSRHRRDPPLSPTYAISRSTLRENTPSITISIRCDLAKARSRSTVTGMFAGEIAIGADWRSRSCVRALSLSLSLIFRKYFEGKIEV